MKTYVIMIAKNFFKGHINAGEPTNFRRKIEKGEKIHTIRPNYDLWAKRIYEVNMGQAILSIREWIEKPYHSKQTIAKNDGLTPDQFNSWFKNYDLSQPMAIIHFTPFRY